MLKSDHALIFNFAFIFPCIIIDNFNASNNFLTNNNIKPNNGPNDSQKIKNFLDKMMPNQQQGPCEVVAQHKESTLRTTQADSSSNNAISMLAMLQQHQIGAETLPKLSSGQAKTLEEIENELLASNQPNKASSSRSINNNIDKITN